ncbi:class I SAM-dependent methyltransferase [Endothiovibrio diazotrophicus]
MSRKIQEYWDKQAVLNREEVDELKVFDWQSDHFVDAKGQGGTLKDHNLREIEVSSMCEEIGEAKRVLDIGCGNGYSTIQYASRIGDLEIVGADFSEEMVANARAKLERDHPELLGRVRFEWGDLTKLSEMNEEPFDAVCTTRSIINLPSWEAQQKAMDEIHSILKPGGRLIMLEGSVDTVNRMNEVRSTLEMGMDKAGNWHNIFLEDAKVREYVPGKYELVKERYHSSTYMLVSRVLYHKVILGKYIDQFTYDEDLFDAAAKLPNFGEYGYHKIFVLKKI